MKPIRTNFKGYEGKYVATDTRTGQTSRSTSVLAEPKAPWLYPYREDPQQTRLGQPVFRPFVPVSFAAGDASTPELEGLIDTGADAILASGLLAAELDLDLPDNEGELLHAVQLEARAPGVPVDSESQRARMLQPPAAGGMRR